jgi:MFS family permease
MKLLFITSIILFEVGSALCGAAPSMNALIVGRVVAGVGGSGVYIGFVSFLCHPFIITDIRSQNT